MKSYTPEEKIILHIEKTGIMMPFWETYWSVQKRFFVPVIFAAFCFFTAQDRETPAVLVMNVCLALACVIIPLNCAYSECMMWKAIRPFVDYQKLTEEARQLKATKNRRQTPTL